MNLRRSLGALLASEPLRPYGARWLWFGLLRRARPSYLVDCWRYPSAPFPPPRGRPLLVPRGTVEPDLLFLPMTDWHARRQRTQQLALSLAAAGHRCFYVNPHLGFQFLRTHLMDRRHRLSTLGSLILELHVRLPREPVIHSRLATPQENRILANALTQMVRLAGTKKLVQIVSLPFWLDAALRVRDELGAPIVYDCHDHLGGFARVGRALVEREADLFRCCDFAVFPSQPLMDSKIAAWPELSGRSRLVRNAGEPGWRDVPGKTDRRTDSAKIIGYVGALDHWFDVDAVGEAARRRPDWRFVLIGRVEHPSIWALGSLPNVQLLGEIPHSELGQRIAGFDVGLIPFLINDLTRAANPIKVYEYFSHGLPVVSSDLPEVRVFGELVYIYHGPADFTAQVEAAAAERDETVRQRRMAVAAQETWANRAAEFHRIFSELRLRYPC